MRKPSRINRQAGRHALVDGIPFTLPVAGHRTPALMVAFPINAAKAAALLPGNELHPMVVFGNTGVLLITVVDYIDTNIGRYIEFSIGIGCTHGTRPAPPLLPLLPILSDHYQMGQYVFDLPVSTDISVKGGKGIWGMPKHKANLDFRIEETTVSSQYDLDGQLCMRITMDRTRPWLPVTSSAINFCEFRGLLMKSSIYFKGKVGLSLFKKGQTELLIGDHPRVARLKSLEIGDKPLATIFFPSAEGVLDDHFESWFVSSDEPPTSQPEGFESVIDLPLDEEWLPAPSAAGRTPDQPGEHAQPAEAAPPLVSPSHAPEPAAASDGAVPDTGAA